MLKRVGFWIGFLVLQLFVGLLTVEFLFRLARPHHPGLNTLLYSPTIETQYDRVRATEELLRGTSLGYRPGEEYCGFVLNSRGFRTYEYTERKDTDRLRVVVLGDSFTFASGCVPWKDFWPVRLERRLNERLNSQTEVLSLGVPGVGPRFSLRVWELEGARLRPELVIFAFFVGNDFFDEQGSELEDREVRWLFDVSYTLRLARNLGRLIPELRRLETMPGSIGADVEGARKMGVPVPGWEERYDPMEPTISEEAHLEIGWRWLQLVHRGRRDRFERLLGNVEAVLARMHAEVEASGAEFLVMLIPDEIQIDAGVRARVLEHHGASVANFDLELPQTRLGGSLEALGIPYLDLLPTFRERGDREALYRYRNTHWNVEGSRLAADTLSEAAADLLRKE